MRRPAMLPKGVTTKQVGITMDLLFDAEHDIGERHDVNYEHMKIVHDLKAKLKAWEAEMDASETSW